MVRDDFWMAATRFMRDLEIRLVEGENSAAVDLFDLLHARRVLTAYGRAYGVLPESSSELTAEQRAFLEQSVSGLAQDGKVISVRLALFAEMVKGKPWTPATLKDVGGTQGVGVTFLEETFGAKTAPPEHRLHQKAAQAILKALLPRTGADIKGQMRSEAELREASGYAGRPRDFDDVIGILDQELRLITPTDPEGLNDETPTARPPSGRYYQLTHDYLVHSLSEWLTRKQRETRRGRAELRLAERAAIWESKPENRHLPSLSEWISIRTRSRAKGWTEPQRRMMRRACLVHGMRAVGMAAFVGLLVAIGVNAWNRQSESAKYLVDLLLKADIAEVPKLIQELEDERLWTDPELRNVITRPWTPPKAKLHASLALLSVDPDQVPYLGIRLRDAAPGEVSVLRDALQSSQGRLSPPLWSDLEGAEAGSSLILPVAAALARFDVDSPHWAGVVDKVAQALVSVGSDGLDSWIGVLDPIHDKLRNPLRAIFRDPSRPESEHLLTTYGLKAYASDDPGFLADLLMDADPKAYAILFPIAAGEAEKTSSVFQAELDRKIEATLDEAEKDRRAARQARAAISLVRLGKSDAVWPRLRHSEEPRLRSFIVNWLHRLDPDPKPVVDGFHRIPAKSRPAVTTGSTAMSDILFDAETSTRRALILAMGTYRPEDLAPAERETMINQLLGLYREDPDAGIHGAAEWTLRRWKQQDRVKAADSMLKGFKNPDERRWYVNELEQTFAVIDGPVEFVTGEPESDRERAGGDQQPQKAAIRRRFAIATKEVTVVQFREFLETYTIFKPDKGDEPVIAQYSPSPDGPAIGVEWYAAAAYCNWLSAREGLPREQWCYEPGKDNSYGEGMTIPADVLVRKGYRLPTEAEWEYACRAGSVTSRYYGVSIGLLEGYEWYRANSPGHAQPCGGLMPNDLGLFDMLGNVYEWSQDGNRAKRPDEGGVRIDVILASDPVENRLERIIRGGAFGAEPRDSRSARRNSEIPKTGNVFFGFRLARTLP
jgi:formylglycine-generating enzyme required for sulfatase activity